MENIHERFRRRCKKCKKRVTLYIFMRNGKKYCKCPKCLAEEVFYKKVFNRPIETNLISKKAL